MKITRLTAENVKRLTAVTIEPTDPLTVVGGKHEAGKSSVLDSIMYVLAGGKTIPPQPLRRGETHGKIVLKLDGDESGVGLPMTVTRRFSKNGTTSLEIKTADGFKAPGPQAILDELCGRIAFDPLAFTKLKPRQQAEAVRELLGLDFEDSDRRRQVLYDQRTIVNREAKSLGSQLEATVMLDGVPAEEVSVSELVKELERRQQINRDNQHERSEVAIIERRVGQKADLCKALDSQIRQLQSEFETAAGELGTLKAEATKANSEIASLVDLECQEIHDQLTKADETNREVRANAKHAELKGMFAAKEEVSAELTKKIDALDETKQAEIAAADFPVDGMGFGDDGLTLDDFPLEQINTKRQIEVSVAMGFAANPTLPVLLIREGSLIDVSCLPAIAKMAEEHKGQIWMERVSEGAECSVIIEDGHVQARTEDDLEFSECDD